MSYSNLQPINPEEFYEQLTRWTGDLYTKQVDVTAITLPSIFWPSVTAWVNPITGVDIPVKRVPLLTTVSRAPKQSTCCCHCKYKEVNE
jgi:hypothetical protein